MTSTAITINNLTKTFGARFRRRVVAVKNLSLEIEAGQVYGFLGPNGAGKTTTIRMLLDLVRPDAGDVYLFGKHVQRQRTILGQVGALVEGASFYPFLKGWRNLHVMALSANLHVSRSEINRLLERVGLAKDGNRRVRGYSTGMKQRLGLAAATLGDPDLLILDEPTNGLDPHGIHDVRRFIRELVDEQGKTVFLSSHILNEVEQVCDRVAIIQHGAMVREGRVDELLAEKPLMRLHVQPSAQAGAILGDHWTIRPYEEDDMLLVEANLDDAPTIVEQLVANSVKVFEIVRHQQSLEDYFLDVTGDDDHAA